MGSAKWRWRPALALALALVAAVALVAVGTLPTRTTEEASLYPDGIYPDAPGGMSWRADLSRPITEDPWMVTGGDATYDVADGMLQISGPIPRVYVRNPSLDRQWRDVEITVYFKRVEDSDTPYSGMTAVARTNHGAVTGLDEGSCDTRGISARLRNDGATDFAKETAHPNWAAVARKPIWRGGMPRDRWLGFKYVVYDLDGGGVRQETWLDLGGGTWRMVNWHDDFGGWWGEVPCAPGIDPTMPLTAAPDREGSESGLPNLGVYFRADGIGENGLLYKSMSIREIEPPVELFSDASVN